jgi:hypothetical protein
MKMKNGLFGGWLLINCMMTSGLFLSYDATSSNWLEFSLVGSLTLNQQPKLPNSPISFETWTLQTHPSYRLQTINLNLKPLKRTVPAGHMQVLVLFSTSKFAREGRSHLRLWGWPTPTSEMNSGRRWSLVCSSRMTQHTNWLDLYPRKDWSPEWKFFSSIISKAHNPNL